MLQSTHTRFTWIELPNLSQLQICLKTTGAIKNNCISFILINWDMRYYLKFYDTWSIRAEGCQQSDELVGLCEQGCLCERSERCFMQTFQVCSVHVACWFLRVWKKYTTESENNVQIKKNKSLPCTLLEHIYFKLIHTIYFLHINLFWSASHMELLWGLLI